VQVKRPASTDFVDWLTHVKRLAGSLRPQTPGSYIFRVSIYPGTGEVRPHGYSPPAVVRWESD
jgi:hypothetical protein